MSAYELRVYEVAQGEMTTREAIFHVLVLPMLGDFGIRSIGYWKAPDDGSFIYVVEHPSLSSVIRTVIW